METQEFVNFIVHALLFWLVYKIGQLHGGVNAVRALRDQPQITDKIKLPRQRPIITVEEINGVYYAYDGNDFLAQGQTPDELGKLIANRFPNRYHLAKIEMRV